MDVWNYTTYKDFLSIRNVNRISMLISMAKRGNPTAMTQYVELKDVDFASSDLLPLSGLQTRLSFGGTRELSSRGIPVGVIVRNDDYADLYRAALEVSRDEGLPVKVVTPEYLAALKLAAAREKDELDLKDLIDRGVIDRPLARSIIKKCLGEYAARAFDTVCDEVDWRQSHRRED